MTSLLPFAMFAFVISITPGPSNILILGTAARFGFAAALPAVWGSCAGAAALVLLVGVGAGGWLQDHPQVQTVLAWASAAWLSYLAWKIAAQPTGMELEDKRAARPVSASKAASIQVANPKAWAVVLAVITVYTGTHANARDYAILSLVLFVISFACLGLWAVLGHVTQAAVRRMKAQRLINIGLGLMLFASVCMEFWP